MSDGVLQMLDVINLCVLMFVKMNTIDDHGHLERLSKGDAVSVRGRITYVNAAAGLGTIMLEEGQFAESKRLVSTGYGEKPDSF